MLSDGCPHDLTPPSHLQPARVPRYLLHGLVEQLRCPSADQVQKCRTSGRFEPMGEHSARAAGGR